MMSSTVIASEAKQSSRSSERFWIASSLALLAMTRPVGQSTLPSPGAEPVIGRAFARPVGADLSPQAGRGEDDQQWGLLGGHRFGGGGLGGAGRGGGGAGRGGGGAGRAAGCGRGGGAALGGGGGGGARRVSGFGGGGGGVGFDGAAVGAVGGARRSCSCGAGVVGWPCATGGLPGALGAPFSSRRFGCPGCVVSLFGAAPGAFGAVFSSRRLGRPCSAGVLESRFGAAPGGAGGAPFCPGTGSALAFGNS